MRIVVLIDPETFHSDDPAFEGKNEDILKQMEFHVIEALRFMGHDISVVVFDRDIPLTIQRINKANPELVFNLTEHVGGDRRKDMHVVALLELLDIPFTGAGCYGLMICRDKAMCKRILSHHRIKVPNFASLPAGTTKLNRKLKFPLIVKPVYEDGSDGISRASLVYDADELAERTRGIHERMRQPVICEEYIDGREIYVGIVGNQRLRALPPRELLFGKTANGAGPKFATARVKHDDVYRDKWGISYRHADLDPTLQARAERLSKRVYKLLEIRDYGRVDWRVTPDGELVFLEANANPDLSLGDELAESWEKAGKDYLDLIGTIVRQAARRINT